MTSTAERSYPTSEVRGRSGRTPCRKGGGQEELPHIRGQGQRPRAPPPLETHGACSPCSSRSRLREELPRSVGAQYATGDQWRNNSRKNEGMGPKQKQYPAVNVTGDRSKVRCCKEQYCIGTWNIRSMNQGKLEVVKETARVNQSVVPRWAASASPGNLLQIEILRPYLLL